MFNKKSSMRGQALVETLFLLPVFAVLISMISWFTHIMLTKQQLITAARYGTDLIAYSSLNENQIRDEIRIYLCDTKLPGRQLEPEKFTDNTVVIVMNRFPKVTTANVITLVPEFFNPKTSYVALSYTCELPALFRILSSASGDAIPSTITIGAHAEVLAGTGA